MNFGLIKTVGKVIVSFGVNTIVSNVIKTTAPAASKGLVNRVCMAAGSLAISSWITSKVTDKFEADFDKVFDVKAEKEVENQPAELKLVEK